MNNKNAGRATGIAFIIATAAGVASLPLISVIDTKDYLVRISTSPNKMILGGLLVMLMGLACASIPYWIYPILSKHRKSLAIASVGFRTIEGTIILFVAIILMTLVPISDAYIYTGGEAILASGNMLVAIQKSISPVLGIVFAIGALMYNIGFFQVRLVPRYLAAWGILAVMMHILASLLVVFGTDAFSPVTILLNIPIALQEMVMAIYLILFGFKEVSTI